MRPRSPGAGNARELAVMRVLAEEGWLCASRRHIGGAGDVLAVMPDESAQEARTMLACPYYQGKGTCISGCYSEPACETDRPTEGWEAQAEGIQAILIEVKSTAGGPWERFGPADREALVSTAERVGAEAWLFHWPPRGRLKRIHSSEFPRQSNPRPEVEFPTLEEAQAEHARAVIERQDDA